MQIPLTMENTPIRLPYFSLILLAFALSCNTTEPLEPPPAHISTIEVTREDVGVTELWIRIRFLDANPSRQFQLFKNDSLFLSATITSADTVLHDEYCAANRSYRYRAFRISEGSIVDSSEVSTIATLDSSSSAWTGVIDTLGDGNASMLYDVVIVNDTMVFAVGEIYLRDSTGFSDRYNVARWDGSDWSILRLAENNLIPVFFSTISFGAEDIWVAGNAVFRWNGFQWTLLPAGLPFSVRINKIWGSNPTNLYAVADGGRISRYNGSSWESQSSPTTMNLCGIHGSSPSEVYVSGIETGGLRSEIVQYGGIGWSHTISGYYPGLGFDTTQLFETQLYGNLVGLWNPRHGRVIVVGDRVYELCHGKWRFLPGIEDNGLSYPIYSRGYLLGVSGSDVNDFIFVGERSTIRHYNGIREKQIGISFSWGSNLHLRAISVRGNFAVAVGRVGSKAVIVRLYR